MYQLLVNEQEVRNTLKSNIIALFVLLKSYNAETLLYIFFYYYNFAYYVSIGAAVFCPGGAKVVITGGNDCVPKKLYLLKQAIVNLAHRPLSVICLP